MTISTKDWRAYIDRLAALNDKAAEQIGGQIVRDIGRVAQGR